MSRYVFKLPDLGEGTVEAEIVAWRVKPGDVIAEDDALVEMMTEKATVEVPSPVGGRVVAVRGAPGDRIAVGAELAVFDTQASAPPPEAEGSARADEPRESTGSAPATAPPRASEQTAAAAPAAARVMTSPAIRRRAREAGVDLAGISGSGPGGRIMRADFERHVRSDAARAAEPAAPGTATPLRVAAAAPAPSAREGATEEVRIIGLRRVIAERMEATLRIPHFSYVEEIDVTELEALRSELNARAGKSSPPLTYLPFLVCALVRAVRAYPQVNALHDAERGVLVRHRAVHVGIATQTPDGLKVPVLRDAQTKSVQEIAAEIRRLSEAARSNKAGRAELTGSTITLTSLGKLGGIVSTPIINAPELAIIGVNRAVERAVVSAGAIGIRRMMNLSSSFDHRFIDGYDAAAFVQELKALLEHPATIFMS